MPPFPLDESSSMAIDKKLKEGNNWHEAAAFNLRQIANNRSIKFLALSIMQYSAR
jgi:hypothetical protein